MSAMASHITGVSIIYSTFKPNSKKTPKLPVTGLYEGNSPITGEFPHKGPVTRVMFQFDHVFHGDSQNAVGFLYCTINYYTQYCVQKYDHGCTLWSGVGAGDSYCLHECIFIRPYEKRSYYAVAMSIRRPAEFSGLFGTRFDISISNLLYTFSRWDDM